MKFLNAEYQSPGHFQLTNQILDQLECQNYENQYVSLHKIQTYLAVTKTPLIYTISNSSKKNKSTKIQKSSKS